MEVIHTPLTVVNSNVEDKLMPMRNKAYSNLEVARVEEFNEENGVVTLYLFDSNRFARNVPFCFPIYNAGYGIIFAPTPGAMCMVGKDARGNIRIMGFLSPDAVDKNGALTRNIPQLGEYNIPKLRSGEIMLKGPEGNIIYLDREGNITFNSSTHAYIRLDSDGNIDMDAEELSSASGKYIEEVYDENYIPYMKIVKGKHDYFPIQDSESSIELCYSVTIKNQESPIAFFGLDAEGNIHLKRGKIIEY